MKNTILLLSIIGLICINFIAWFAVFNICSSPDLKVSFLNVGQGDAILIQIASQYQILIDGGPGKKVLQGLSEKMDLHDKEIDLIVLTHPEKDHLEGLISVLEQYQVNHIIWTGISRDTDLYQEWIKVIEKEQANILIAQAGQEIVFPGANLSILYPLNSLQGTKPKDANPTSIVTRFCYSETCFLFPGDIYSKQEKELMSLGIDLESEVLKLAHHGSKTSTSEQFIIFVNPKIAVAQAGKDNSYGHPNEKVVQRLESNNIKILTTMNNDVEIVLDNNELNIYE